MRDPKNSLHFPLDAALTATLSKGMNTSGMILNNRRLNCGHFRRQRK